MRYILTETVGHIKERFTWDATKSLGWWIHFEGSGEAFYISDEEPDLKAGDKVKITLEKVT